MNKVFNRKKGFTLVEILVVIVVLSVLVLLGMPRFTGYIQEAELKRIQSDVRVMENQLVESLSNNKYNDWKDTDKDLGSLVLRKQLFEREGIAKNVDMNYIRYKKTKGNVEGELSLLENDVNLFNSNDESKLGYKIVPNEYKDKINTKLKGTFYTNENGKVYYEQVIKMYII